MKKGTSWSCFGKVTLECKDSNGKTHKLKVNKNSLINLIINEAQKQGESKGSIKLKKSFLGMGGSSNKKVQNAFKQFFANQPIQQSVVSHPHHPQTSKPNASPESRPIKPTPINQPVQQSVTTSSPSRATSIKILSSKSTPIKPPPVSSSSALKTNEAKTKAYVIPKNIDPQLYNKLDKRFIGEILDSNSYSSAEKDMLFDRAALDAYTKEGRILGPTDWTDEIAITIPYLKLFAFNNRNFSPIKSDHQFEDNNLEQNIGALLSYLPSKIDKGPRVYGQPLRISGNHRTAFVIDMNNKTVEYFNSFGEDTKAKAPLTALAKALTQKYGVTFNYHHRTPNIRLQPDIYQCGIWTDELIEERFKQGKNFNPATLRNFNIAQYRSKVQAEVHQFYFFREVGRARLDTYVRQNIDGAGSKDELALKADALNEKACELAEEKFERPFLEIMDLICIEWARGPQNQVPELVKNLVQEAKAQLQRG